MRRLNGIRGSFASAGEVVAALEGEPSEVRAAAAGAAGSHLG
jgi:hypothetical protein